MRLPQAPKSPPSPALQSPPYLAPSSPQPDENDFENLQKMFQKMFQENEEEDEDGI